MATKRATKAAKTAISPKAKPKAQPKAKAPAKTQTKAQAEATIEPPAKRRVMPNKSAPDVASRAANANAKGGAITEDAPQRPRRGGHYKGGPGGGATSDSEQLFRLRIVEQAIIDGKRGGQILEVLKGHGRDISYSTLSMYMRRVRDKWAHEDSLLRPIWRERQMRKIHDVADRLERGGHWGHWIACQKLIADLEGNLAPVKVEHKQVEEFDGWTVEELEAYVASKGQVRPERFAEGSGTAGSGYAGRQVPVTAGSEAIH
jgi:hypothetical protein